MLLTVRYRNSTVLTFNVKTLKEARETVLSMYLTFPWQRNEVSALVDDTHVVSIYKGKVTSRRIK